MADQDLDWRPGRAGTRPPATAPHGLWLIVLAHRGVFAAAAVGELLAKGLAIATAVVAAGMVGRAAAGERDLGGPFLAVLVLIVARALALWWSTLVSHRLAYRVLAEIRSWVYWALERSAPASMMSMRSGDVMTRILGDAESLEVFYAHVVINAIVGVVLPLTTVAVVSVVAGPLAAAVVVAGLIAAATVPLLVIRANRQTGREVRAATSALADTATDLLDGMRELALFGRYPEHRRTVMSASSRLADAQGRYRSRSAAEMAAGHACLGLTLAATLVVLAGAVRAGELAATVVPPVIIGVAAAFAPVQDAVSGARIAGRLEASARRLFDVLGLPETIVDAGQEKLATTGPAAVEMTGVWFTYPGQERPALRDVHLQIRAGERLALVGSSGAGKSTLAHLLLRWWDPQAGEVRLDGRPLPDMPYAHLVQHVGHVPQDVFCFHASVRENLLIGGRHHAADDAAVPAADLAVACERACLTDVIERFDAGLDTVVGQRGGRLSGGERQRLAIARALLRDSRLLVLDEATSHLDSASEARLHQALDLDRGRRTTVVVAHRLATILACDRVAYLADGQVVAVGTHEELIAGLPGYADLIAAQRDALVAVGRRPDVERR